MARALTSHIHTRTHRQCTRALAHSRAFASAAALCPSSCAARALPPSPPLHCRTAGIGGGCGHCGCDRQQRRQESLRSAFAATNTDSSYDALPQRVRLPWTHHRQRQVVPMCRRSAIAAGARAHCSCPAHFARLFVAAFTAHGHRERTCWLGAHKQVAAAVAVAGDVCDAADGEARGSLCDAGARADAPVVLDTCVHACFARCVRSSTCPNGARSCWMRTRCLYRRSSIYNAVTKWPMRLRTSPAASSAPARQYRRTWAYLTVAAQIPAPPAREPHLPCARCRQRESS